VRLVLLVRGVLLVRAVVTEAEAAAVVHRAVAVVEVVVEAAAEDVVSNC
jgi:hypothetical protein